VHTIDVNHDEGIVVSHSALFLWDVSGKDGHLYRVAEPEAVELPVAQVCQQIIYLVFWCGSRFSCLKQSEAMRPAFGSHLFSRIPPTACKMGASQSLSVYMA
jgi:hypothetical protein